MKNKHKYTMPVLVMIITLVVWEFCVRFFKISLYILPAPTKIASAIVSDFPVLWQHSMVTLQEAIIGLVISTVLAIIIAIGMDMSKSFKTSIYPHLIVTQTVPVMVLGPLFSIWLGFGLAPKVLIVIFMCFFPIVVSFVDALGQVDLNQINLLKSFGANTFQIYKMVKIPSGAIGLFSGLKVSATYCIGGAIVGEWLSSSAGLGYYMLRVKNGYMLDKVFACVVMIILWSLLLHLLVTFIEYLAFPHLRKKKGEKK
ncbi:MAG: ABC transporter permease [Holdemanella sp.]|nr:ABC transporter permease [Holdemanella sp.]